MLNGQTSGTSDRGHGESDEIQWGVVPAAAARMAFDRLLDRLGAERVAAVRNPSYIWSPLEFYPLPPRRERLSEVAAVVMDMDGTTTTTEPLCLHSLAYMVRSITDLWTPDQWSGFDPAQDLPHVIGDSTTRHVEYILTAYADRIRSDLFARRFLWTCAWTMACGRDPGRRIEALADLAAFGVGSVMEEPGFRAWGEGPAEVEPPQAVAEVLSRLAPRFAQSSFPDRVRAAVTIYYQRYHEILAGIREGRGAAIARDVLTDETATLVEPMRHVAIFLSMVKGKLGSAGPALYPVLAAGYGSAPPAARDRFLRQCRLFAERPAKLAIVTSSIRYEAEIVLGEVLRICRDQVAAWPVGGELREELRGLFRGIESLYDAFITANDSSEIRLKPHRDLYAIALQRLGLDVREYPAVLGLEDSTAGVTAIKAAGCGLCIAVPFEATAHHDFGCADHVVRGGLGEVILERGCFLSCCS